MDKESLKELKELSKYLEISNDEFKQLLFLALSYKNEEGKSIHEEKIYEVIEEALNNMDYSDINKYNSSIGFSKTVEEAFERALVNLGYQKTKKKIVRSYI